MKIQTRFYFANGDCLDATVGFDELCKVLDSGNALSKVYLVYDKSGREHLIPWSAVSHVENLNNHYDKLMEHRGEKSELGVAAEFVHKLPYSWELPQTDRAADVWQWIKTHQSYFPKEFQQIYIKIAHTLLKEWEMSNTAGKIEELQKESANIRELGDEQLPVMVKSLYEFLRSKMPEIERQVHKSTEEGKHA
ncbi:hypothetical protein lacNasYZ03_11450 [Lactobacillus nasalidis]|uniref:Uncharacterized protein n=1 Tax=Lactobacillus nasalidis TaxID=2797258 RepID=A0ABQ3W4K9_9LACO|nr:hypothetical protein [Lactobacillus nasalidis]GHV97869.1 hypothetical protein lacNasYZ01_10510 [Lactobacillus nasalidis]GHW00099.1 hypothetical protein lacNasYZ02_15280 [Lactobacillus nasalidis]GHW01458.1 hypothetical protein lacNasYZ03_11450 [Lactobacillus nasalidis]